MPAALRAGRGGAVPVRGLRLAVEFAQHGRVRARQPAPDGAAAVAQQF